MSVVLTTHLTPTLCGVVPILPTLANLFWLIPAILVAASTALWGLIGWRNGRWLGAVLWRLKWQLTVSVALVVSLFILAQFAYQALKVKPHGMGSEANDWKMARGGLRREGSLHGREPTNGDVVWNLRRGSEAFYASPAIVGNRLYTVGSRGGTGRIYCLDAQQGEILWSCSPAGYAATFSSPVISQDRLVVGEGLHHTRAGRIVCLDLRKGYEGRVRWMFRTASHVECTPIIDGDRVYVNAGDDGVYCLALSPTQRQGEVIWHIPGKTLPDAETSLAVYDGMVYAGLGLGGEAMCAIDALTGQIRFRQKLPYPVFSLPAIASGRLYVGMGIGDVVTPLATPAGQLGCFELPSLKPVWMRPLPATVMGAVSVTNDGVLCGCGDGNVYRFHSQGQLEAQYATGAPIVGSAAVTERHCYVVNQSGELWCLNLPDLAPSWSTRLGARGHYTSSPVSAHGHIYVGTDNDGIFCLGSQASACWSSPRGGAGAVGCRDDSRVGAQGKIKEVSHFEGRVKPLAAIGEFLLVASEMDRSTDLICLQIQSDGQEQRAVPQWQERSRAADISACAILEVDHAEPQCLVLQRGVAGGVELRCLGLHTGQLSWTEKFHGNASDLLTTDGQSLFVQPVAGTLRCFAIDGQTKWEREIGTVTQAVAYDSARIAVATSHPNAVHLLDKLTGGELWSVKLSSAPTAAPVMYDDTVIVGTEDSLTVRSVIDGNLRWRSKASQGGVASEIGLRKESLFWLTTASRLVGVQLQSQRPLMDMDVGAELTDLIRADDGVLLVSGRQVKKVPGQGTAITTWSELPAETAQCGNGVLHDGRLWIGTRDGRLLCLGGEAAR